MDFGVFVFFAAMIYFISVLQNNKKRKKKKTEREIPEETEARRERPTETRAPSQAGGYDAAEFRKKLRTAWKIPEGEKSADDSMDLPDELEKPVYREPVRSAGEAPVCAEERKPKKAALPQRSVLRKTKPEPKRERKPERGMTAAETERQRRMLELAARAETPKEARPIPAPAFAETQSGGRRSGLSAEDARRWVMYDAVFGAPRAKRPWRR